MRAISSSAATPVALSLMPGPTRTESRCAPTSNTRRAPGWVSAMTFCEVEDVRLRHELQLHDRARSRRELGSDSAVDPGYRNRGCLRVAERAVEQSGLRVEDEQGDRAGVRAFRALTAKKQVPRRASAMKPRTPSKSPGSQPSSAATTLRGGRLSGSTASSRAPRPEALAGSARSGLPSRRSPGTGRRESRRREARIPLGGARSEREPPTRGSPRCPRLDCPPERSAIRSKASRSARIRARESSRGSWATISARVDVF